MFIEYLSKEEKEVFFSLALELVSVDDKFSQDEKEKIKVLSLNTLGQDGYDTENLCNDLSKLDTFSKKKIVLTELIQLCYVDGVYCESEKVFIHNLAERLGVDEPTLLEIENWVSGFVNQMNKGIKLINK